MRNNLAGMTVVFLVLVFSGAIFAQGSKADPKSLKKAVAVLNFDDASLGNKELSLGNHLIAALTRELTATKVFAVTERMQIESVMKELNLSFDEAMDPKTAAKVGKRVAANTAIFGTINEYNMTGDQISLMGVTKTKYTATVGFSIRLVDINTGVILESVESTETAKKDLFGTPFGSNNTSESMDFKIKLFTEAANKAVKSIVKQLSPFIQKSDTSQGASTAVSTDTAKPPAAETKNPVAATTTANTTRDAAIVAKVAPKVTRVINGIVFVVGLEGVKIGDILSVVRGAGEGKEVAVIEVTEANERTVKAKIIQGAGVQENDRVKIIQ